MTSRRTSSLALVPPLPPEAPGDEQRRRSISEIAPAVHSDRKTAAGRDAAKQLISILLEQIEEADEPERRVALLHEVASIYEEKLGELEPAFDAMLVAWSEDYTDEATAQALTRLAPRVQGWAELLTVANEALKQELEPRKRVAICLRCATWYNDHLGRPDSAIACYEQTLALDPGHLPATLQLARLYETAGRWDVLPSTLEHAALLTPPGQARVELQLRLATLYEGPLNHPPKAETYYRQILQSDGAHPAAIEALERIYRRDQRWEELVSVLQKAAANASSVEAASSAFLNLATIWHGILHNSSQALSAYEQVIARDDRNLLALRGLERLYKETERWQSLLSVLESQVRAVESDRERVEVLTKLALLWEQRFVKPDKAVAYLEQAQALDPTNAVVLANLARLYRQAKRWHDLLATLEATLGATIEPASALAIHKAIATLCTTELQDLPRAIRAYEQVVTLAANDMEALRGLVQLYERTENTRAAVDSMERLVRVEGDDEKRADLLLRLGELYQRKLGDGQAAVVRFERASALEPKRADILRALREAQLETGDFRAAARTLGEELTLARSPRALAELHLTLSQVLSDKLHDSEKATIHLEAACAHDVANSKAALALAEVHLRKAQWAAALPLLQRVVKGNAVLTGEGRGHATAVGLSSDTLRRAALSLGEVAGRCDEHALSAFGYEQALALDPRNVEAALGAACAHFRAENWQRAQESYERVLGDARADLDAETKAQAFRRTGLALLALGNRRKALSMFEGALKAWPEDTQTLQIVVKLHLDAREWKKVIRYKYLLADLSSEEDRVRLHCEIAAHYRDELDSPRKAIDALSGALERSPSSRVVLLDLLSLYQQTKRWRDAIAVIGKIARLEQDPEIAAKYLYTAAVIARDEVSDGQQALELFEKALDLDPKHLKAFEAINKLLTQEKDWKLLERAFRKMLHRLSTVSAKPELLHQLWQGLGVIYRDRLGDLVSAAQAFAQASRLRPDSDTQHLILAELYERIPGELQRAVSEHDLRIERDPRNPAPYLALYDLYSRHNANDRAWCVARALVHLKQADRKQKAFYESGRSEPRFSSRGLSSEDWLTHLYHPDHDRMLATIFRCIAGPLHERRFGAAPAPSSRQKKAVADKKAEALSAQFRLGVRVLAPDIDPRVTVNLEAPHGLRCELGAIPTTVAGKLVFERKWESELRFLIGHHLAYHRSEHYIRRLLPARQEIGAAFLVAMRSIGKSDNSRGTEKAWEDLSRGLAPEMLERIQKACTLFAKRGEQADLKRFIQTTELTACRAGLLLSDDLSGSIAMLQQLEPAGADDVSPKEKAGELLKFSVSEPYFLLRRKLGIALQ